MFFSLPTSFSFTGCKLNLRSSEVDLAVLIPEELANWAAELQAQRFENSKGHEAAGVGFFQVTVVCLFKSVETNIYFETGFLITPNLLLIFDNSLFHGHTDCLVFSWTNSPETVWIFAKTVDFN